MSTICLLRFPKLGAIEAELGFGNRHTTPLARIEGGGVRRLVAVVSTICLQSVESPPSATTSAKMVSGRDLIDLDDCSVFAGTTGDGDHSAEPSSATAGLPQTDAKASRAQEGGREAFMRLRASGGPLKRCAE
jgi:hypothetical protein